MRRFAVMLLPLAVCVATPALAQASLPEAAIQHFVTAFNKGDSAGAKAVMAEQVAITDEVVPFHWHGSEAFVSWGKDYDSDAKAKGISAPSVMIGAATRTEIEGDHAYVIVPATYRFVQKSVKMEEVAQMTFGLDKVGADWKISAWTWTGPKASVTK